MLAGLLAAPRFRRLIGRESCLVPGGVAGVAPHAVLSCQGAAAVDTARRQPWLGNAWRALLPSSDPVSPVRSVLLREPRGDVEPVPEAKRLRWLDPCRG